MHALLFKIYFIAYTEIWSLLILFFLYLRKSNCGTLLCAIIVKHLKIKGGKMLLNIKFNFHVFPQL